MNVTRIVSFIAILVSYTNFCNAEIDAGKIATDSIERDSQHFYINDNTLPLVEKASTITYYYSNERDYRIELLIDNYSEIIGNDHGVVSNRDTNEKLFMRLVEKSKCNVPSEKLWPSIVLEFKATSNCYQFNLADDNIVMILTGLAKQLRDGINHEINTLELRVESRNLIDGYLDEFAILKPLRDQLHRFSDDIINSYIARKN